MCNSPRALPAGAASSSNGDRSEVPTFSEFEASPYDSASIMPYPQCNGSSDDLSFTSSDADGVRSRYGG